jgi:hypothetical protein
LKTIIHQNCSADTNRLAQHVQDELVRAHGRVNRGVKTDMQQSGINIALLCNTNMPAILTESGFMDNLAESKNHDGFQEKLNKAVPDCQYVPLKVDGIYSPKVRIAVLMFGNQRDGSRMGKIPDGLWDQEPEWHWHS